MINAVGAHIAHRARKLAAVSIEKIFNVLRANDPNTLVINNNFAWLAANIVE